MEPKPTDLRHARCQVEDNGYPGRETADGPLHVGFGRRWCWRFLRSWFWMSRIYAHEVSPVRYVYFQWAE